MGCISSGSVDSECILGTSFLSQRSVTRTFTYIYTYSRHTPLTHFYPFNPYLTSLQPKVNPFANLSYAIRKSSLTYENLNNLSFAWYYRRGAVREWTVSNWNDTRVLNSKTSIPFRVSRVRIPPSPYHEILGNSFL